MADKILQISQELNSRIKKVIKDEKLDMFQARICGIFVYPYIQKTIAGRCIRCGQQLKFFSQYDYIIQISGQFWENLTEKTKDILILHELYHINIKYKKDGTPMFMLRQHDIQDFSDIIEKYGLNWIKQIKLVQEHLKDKKQDQKNG